MHIVAVTGTQIKGCTYAMMESFLSELKEGNTIQTFTLPKDGPPFCLGCKTCFFQSEDQCPHADAVMPIWQAMLAADLIVFAYPVYALRAPAQVKALLDHLCVHWFVHRPDPRMFKKRAVILSQAIGVFSRAARNDVTTSLSWLGVSDIKTLGKGLLEGVVWDELSEKRRAAITRKVKKLAGRYRSYTPAHMSPLVFGKFQMLKLMHRHFAKGAQTLSADDRYWLKTFLTKP